ncbi:hypothetical protein [Gluconobacter kanchanaburiensis]|uniref:Uncharacterized protein n=1 Tax=Gluconobacter kanchanaburiensis NBRC 103587 TaxID=1307948 RepID=A0A511B300_9PROT|nr:hypothetical protein [Gluconobacter kanchanaburiensis]MBF0861015.1 hypothetical protein [Gluconobacter kanchanaburiensis]GBR70228.1 hypothetical protein AA103587_1759 [Gluconobacter kanchanaburiensis NBRC 103587]GEK94804.1 hypothetical protein GKA01_00010 [Gluconobacter kanchanaburiensis NBRC 103587]
MRRIFVFLCAGVFLAGLGFLLGHTVFPSLKKGHCEMSHIDRSVKVFGSSENLTRFVAQQAETAPDMSHSTIHADEDGTTSTIFSVPEHMTQKELRHFTSQALTEKLSYSITWSASQVLLNQASPQPDGTARSLRP